MSKLPKTISMKNPSPPSSPFPSPSPSPSSHPPSPLSLQSSSPPRNCPHRHHLPLHRQPPSPLAPSCRHFPSSPETHTSPPPSPPLTNNILKSRNPSPHTQNQHHHCPLITTPFRHCLTSTPQPSSTADHPYHHHSHPRKRQPSPPQIPLLYQPPPPISFPLLQPPLSPSATITATPFSFSYNRRYPCLLQHCLRHHSNNPHHSPPPDPAAPPPFFLSPSLNSLTTAPRHQTHQQQHRCSPFSLSHNHRPCMSYSHQLLPPTNTQNHLIPETKLPTPFSPPPFFLPSCTTAPTPQPTQPPLFTTITNQFLQTHHQRSRLQSLPPLHHRSTNDTEPTQKFQHSEGTKIMADGFQN